MARFLAETIGAASARRRRDDLCRAAPNLISLCPTELSEDGFYIHTTDEQIPVAALTRNAVLYAHILQELIQAEVAQTRE
jgi:hypothetical protein